MNGRINLNSFVENVEVKKKTETTLREIKTNDELDELKYTRTKKKLCSSMK